MGIDPGHKYAAENLLEMLLYLRSIHQLHCYG